jgi:hypothetical protein
VPPADKLQNVVVCRLNAYGQAVYPFLPEKFQVVKGDAVGINFHRNFRGFKHLANALERIEYLADTPGSIVAGSASAKINAV